MATRVDETPEMLELERVGVNDLGDELYYLQFRVALEAMPGVNYLAVFARSGHCISPLSDNDKLDLPADLFVIDSPTLVHLLEECRGFRATSTNRHLGE